MALKTKKRQSRSLQEKAKDGALELDVEEISDEGDLAASGGRRRSDAELAAHFTRLEFKLAQERGDYLLQQVLDFVRDRKWINLTPDYQRRKRWDAKKKSLLVESLLMNLPVPPVFLFENEPARYEVMDGQQRLNAILEFYENRLEMSGLRSWPELNGRRMSEWPPALRRGMERRRLASVVLRADTADPAIDPVRLRQQVFERLNTGGEKLNSQELRNCLFSGEFNELLIELSRLPEFTGALGIPSYELYEAGKDEPEEPRRSHALYKSMLDCQVVLRFFAFRSVADIKGSVRSMLDSCMREQAKAPRSSIDKMRSEFSARLDMALSLFGKDAFRLPTTGRISVPLYDSLLLGIDRQWMHQKAMMKHAVGLKKGLARLLAEPRHYQILIGKPNKASAVKERIDLVSAMIAGQLNS